MQRASQQLLRRTALWPARCIPTFQHFGLAVQLATHSGEQYISKYRSVLCSGLASYSLGRTINKQSFVCSGLASSYSEEQQISKYRSILCRGLASYSLRRTINKKNIEALYVAVQLVATQKNSTLACKMHPNVPALQPGGPASYSLRRTIHK